MASQKRQDSMDDGEEFVCSNGADNSRGDDDEIAGSDGLVSRLSVGEGGNGDFLMQQSDRESNFLQWLQTLDLQMIGACRADERLKPLLKASSSSSGAAELRLLCHLNQHFESSEVGLLARCLCVPLVSIRVGKVVKQGKLLCPTSIRGSLNLALLPSSDLCLTLVGDDGFIKRLATLRDISECSAVIVDEIPADQSGRSFLIMIPGLETLYFWCAEKSKLLGSELLFKMKDLLRTKPTLSELSGISESRLECLATHLRAFLVGSSGIRTQADSAALAIPWEDIRSNTSEPGVNNQLYPTSARLLRSRHVSSQTMKGLNQHQGSLSPRSSSFKEGFPRTLSSLRSSFREKFRRCDVNLSPVAVLNHSEKGKHSESNISSSESPSSFLESLDKCHSPPQPNTTPHFPPVCSLLTPYYCWCPPCTSPSISSIPLFPTLSTEPFSLPSLSTLLPSSVPSAILTKFPPLDLGNRTPPELPALSTDPLTHLPFSEQSVQQIRTFTPLMCDPIVHIPIINVCSSGQGYLVSTGPAIATNIPPLQPKLVDAMLPEHESLVEKSARETLRLLMASSSSHSTTSSLMGVFPIVLSNDDKQGIVVSGSRGLYSGTRDVEAIVSSFAAVGLVSQSERSIEVGSSASLVASDTIGKDSSDSGNLRGSMFMSRAEEKDF